MRFFPAFLAISFLLFSVGIVNAGTQITLNSGDQNTINQAISQAGGGEVYLNAGTYEITGPIKMISNTKLLGDSNAIVRVSSSSSQLFTGTTGLIGADGQIDNVEIGGFQIDGSCNRLPHSYNSNDQDPHDCERGIAFWCPSSPRGNNIYIHDMKIYDLFSDGVHVSYANNVHVSNLWESNCQHEGVYYCEVNGVEITNCQIAGITSDCLRVENSQNIKVSGNVLFSYSGDSNGAYEHGENGLAVGNQGRSFGVGGGKPDAAKNVEITNNTFSNNGLKAIDEDSGLDNIYIHDNKFIGASELKTMGIPVTVTDVKNDTGIVSNVSENNPPTVEMSQNIFSSISDILNMTFSDVGMIDNHDVQPEMNWQQKGHSKAWVDIVGWNNLTEINGVFYIPDGEQPIVKYDSVSTALAGSTQNYLTTSENNGNVTADLEVKTTYKVIKASSKSIMGISIPSYETYSETSHYFDTEKVPKTFSPAINTTAYIDIKNDSFSKQVVVFVPENIDVMKVCFKYDGTETWHYLHSGTVNTTATGEKYFQISSLDYWDNQSNVSGNQLVLPEYISPKDVKSRIEIVQYDVYGNKIPITNFQIEQEEPLSFWKLLPPKTVLFASIVGIFLYGIRRNLEVFR